MDFSGLSEQYRRIFPEIVLSLQDVLSSGRYIGGTQIKDLELRLAEKCGSRFCLCCANGTDALSLALLNWGVGRRDAVFVPAFTFAATAEAVALRGATPVFVDIDSTFTMNPTALKAAIEQTKREGWLNPAGIITVDLFGVPADYKRIKRIANEENMWLLEDAAQAFGAMRYGRCACSFGDICTTSFFPAKPLGCYGDGGAVFTDSPDYAETIDSLRLHGCGASKYEHNLIGINSRLDTLQAAVLLKKLELFDDETAARRKTAEIYNNALQGYKITPHIPADTLPSWSQYTLLLPDSFMRDRLKLHLSTLGIPSMVYYPTPLHLQGAYAYLGIKRGALPVSEAAAAGVLSIPIHAYLTDDDIFSIIDGIKQHMDSL